MKTTTIYTFHTSSLVIKAFEGIAKVSASLEFTFSSEDELARLLALESMATIVKTFNQVHGHGADVNRFMNRRKGVSRIWAVCQSLVPAPAAETNEQLAAAEASDSGSKKAQVVAMLRRPEGATGAEIQSAMGWQPHTVRGFIAGTVRGKLGLKVTGTREADGTRYRVE